MGGRQLTLHVEAGYSKGPWFGLKCLFLDFAARETLMNVFTFFVSE